MTEEITSSRYVDLGLIAAGGMAQVHLARREGPAGFRKLVALKRMLPQLAHDRSFERMFLNEARLAAGLDHSNLARVLDFGVLGGRYFLAMEYVHGHDLRTVMHRAAKVQPEGVLPLDCSLYVIRSVAAGLHYVHQRSDDRGRPLGLVHRDVSPSNILVSAEGEVKLTDFGIAKATHQVDATATNALRGKLAYMSPEQARGEPLDRRSDIYALGILLFELTTGYRQFVGDNQYELINRVAKGAVTMPHELVPDYPPTLEAIVARALAVHRQDRYSSALALHDALGYFVTQQGLRPEGPRLGQLLGSMFGQQPLPSLDVPFDATVPLGPVTRPRTVDGEPATVRRQSPRPRGRGIALASLVIGIGVGVGITQAMIEPNEAATPSDATATPEQSVTPSTEHAEPGMDPQANAAPPEPADAAVPAPIDPAESSGERSDADLVDDSAPTSSSSSPASSRRPKHRPRSRPRSRASSSTKDKTKPNLDDWTLPKH
ncbi:MAG: serine/threonine-protein kinase [Myxococcota bacterium]